MGKDGNDIAALIHAAAPDLSEDRCRAIAERIQRDLGGSYLKKAPAAGKALRLGAALAAGVPLGVAITEIDCTPRHAYRLLKRRWHR